MGCSSKFGYLRIGDGRKVSQVHEGFFKKVPNLIKTFNHDYRKSTLSILKGRTTFYRQIRQEIPWNRTMRKAVAKRERVRLRETVAREAREIQELGRKSAESVMNRLAEIAQYSPNETAAIAAAQVILDRSYGKANQTNTNVNVDANGKNQDISQKELDARINTALKRVEELTGGKSKAPASKERSIDLRKLDRDPNGSPLN